MRLTSGASRRALPVLATIVMAATVVAPLTGAEAATPPNGSTWFETFIDTPDGQRLHTDVMRPSGLTDADKTPVILIVSPYLGMASNSEQPGPSNRFFDFINGAKVFERGYSVVMVSLRGTGGSSGCLDILGPGEQTDIVTAVRWAATQPWSTGRVGMYGKSYDANTGVAGAALRPEGLAAVVAQQIVPDRYRGSYNDRVRYAQSVQYPSASYGAGGEGTFSINGSTEYMTNSLSHSADCQVWLAEHYLDDPTSEFWTVRDFVERAEGSTVPTFITAGFLDNNTNIGGGAVEFYNALDGPKRMWLGWWDHVRGNDMVGGQLAMGRAGFFNEVMRFFDRYVKGAPMSEAPVELDPKIVIEGSDGTWRSEQQWPPADAAVLDAPLLAGTYQDDAKNEGSNDSGLGAGGSGAIGSATRGAGAWTFSEPLPYDAHVAGIPSATVNVTPVVPRTNLVVNIYDVDPDGNATMISRGAGLADAAGPEEVLLYPTDWVFAAGHRIGLLVSGSNVEAYTHVPTQTTVTVNGGVVHLPFLRFYRPPDLEGDTSPRLTSYLSGAPFSVTGATITGRTNPAFTAPPQQEPAPQTEEAA